MIKSLRELETCEIIIIIKSQMYLKVTKGYDKGYVGRVEGKGYGRGRDRATPVWRCLERPPFCTLPTSGSGDSKCP